MKQHLVKLRQRSREIVADLESELGFADKIFQTSSTIQKDNIKREIELFLQLVDRHRQIEKERQKQTEFLFQ